MKVSKSSSGSGTLGAGVAGATGVAGVAGGLSDGGLGLPVFLFFFFCLRISKRIGTKE